MARGSRAPSKAFPAPYMGVTLTIPEHEIDPRALFAAFNCVYSQGQVLTRDSMVKLSTITGASNPSFDTRPLGAWSTTEITGNFDLFVSTHTNLYRLRNFTGSWTDVSGALTLTNNNAHVARWASLYNKATDQTATLMVNGIDDASLSLDGGNFTTPAVGGPKAIDICTAASRFIAIVPPYRVIWSDVYAYSFPALNTHTALDSTGKVIAVRQLGTLGFVVYKDDAIVAAYSQPGSPAQAFRFESRLDIPGPAGPSAVVQAIGRHFVMTKKGRIWMFDGTRLEFVGDGAWPYLVSDFDFANAHQTHGFYQEGHDLVWFIYPRISDSGNGPTGVAIITSPRPAWGIHSYGVWPGSLAVPASASTTIKLSSVGHTGFITRSDAGNLGADVMTNPISYSTFGDDEIDFSCFLQTGLQPVGEVNKVEIEVFLHRGADHGECTLSPVSSYILDTQGGTVGTGQTIDLEATNLVRDVRGFNASGRFIGLKLEWQSRVPEAETGPEEGGIVRYKGAILTGYPVEGP
jgi:hypothetical protein